MRLLPTPATVAEQYLAAILEELRAIRVPLEGGSQAQGLPALVHAGEWRITRDDAAEASEKALTKAAASPPTKRTRTRTR